ncbi:MAG: imidazolonepropionase [Clostridiales bacterium]|nr:imidazolonepropionase [Clostridiales bacterium]MDD7035853.1 imidazolonepropionase [Bacillota bacterium]MDY2920093.1 imidazolonepropionase [Lentihominibacter sp.]
MKRTLVKNIGILQTPAGCYSHKGSKQGVNLKLKDAAIAIEDGLIREITEDGKLPEGEFDEVIDAEGNLVTPGLVDGHTHLVFGGYRQHEIAMKLAGADYLDILKAGGGILDTVRKTREATEEELVEKSMGFLDEMLNLGVTTTEIKSGYGLDLENELKLLRVIRTLGEKHAMDVVPTFMGPHAVPPEYEGRGDEYIDMVCSTMLPEIRKENLAEFCDVFTEDSVFNAEQSRRYMTCARSLGFELKIHADEIEAIGGSELAGEMGAASAEHLIAITESGMEALAAGGTTAMCLPATSFYLDKTYAPARKMIEKGIPVAIASDFNPGSCPSLNLQFAANLGSLKYKLTPEEVLTAITINPACAIDRGDVVGTLEKGKQADLVIWDAPDFEMICYRFGSNLAKHVIKNGELVK